MRVSTFSLRSSVRHADGAYRSFRGVDTVCRPPVDGRSASFCLRFRFVRVVRAMRAVRAGEAKLRRRMTIVVLQV